MKILITLVLMFALLRGHAQDDHKFRQLYPVGEGADINYKFLRYHETEKILFEANPTVRYSFHNMIRQRLAEGERHADAYYLSFRPQLRMYADNSKPVRTPSYRILVATQHVWTVEDDNLVAVSFETGHYSNGQDRSAFSEMFADESAGSDSLYALIDDNSNLSDMLNRSSGNFSTNLTELVVNYRFNKLNSNCIIDRWHLVKAGVTLYHDRLLYFIPIGGYSDEDIRLYGRARLMFGYEFMRARTVPCRWSLGATVEYITNPHPHVAPWRGVVTGTLYPFKGNDAFGFFANIIGGHDDYNFRFVDSGLQLSLGMTWNPFPPVQLGPCE